jgi:hypothetical protein
MSTPGCARVGKTKQVAGCQLRPDVAERPMQPEYGAQRSESTHFDLILFAHRRSQANLAGVMSTVNFGEIAMSVCKASAIVILACAASLSAMSQPSTEFVQPGYGAVARKLNEKAMEHVSIKDFGARGDGVTDDTNAIQAAINAHDCIFVPPGIYRTRGLSIPGGVTGKMIFGAGKGRSTIENVGRGAALMSVGDGKKGNWNVTVRDVSLKGNPDSQHGIFFDYTYHSKIESVETYGHGADGIKIQRGFYNDISSVWSHDNGGSGVFFGRTANANNVFGGHYRINRGSGIRIDSEADRDRAHGNSVFGATVEANRAFGVDIVDADENRLLGMYLESNAGFGTVAQVRIGGDSGSANFNVVEASNFTGDVLSVLVNQARGTIVKSSSINFGVNITARAQRTRLIGNSRVEGKVIDDGDSTAMFNDPAVGRWYVKNEKKNGYELVVGGAATVQKFGDNYLRYDFTDLPDAFRFRSLSLGGSHVAVMHFGAHRLWINPVNGKLYVKSSDPEHLTDGTVVGLQQ